MFHHVCPAAAVPSSAQTRAREGWPYTLDPADFAFQLEALRRRGFTFVPLDTYVRRAVDDDAGPGRMVAVTFDDGWLDNHTHALPVLARLGIPATFFVVSGEMPGVPAAHRMTPAMLRDLVAAGMTIGAHSRTHPNLATLTGARLDDEIGGCKADLEAVVGHPVAYLAYPGGRFNAEVVACARRHGFRAACSVIPSGRNAADARYWLSRDVFSPRMRTLRDRLLLHPVGRWAWRTARRHKAALQGPPPAARDAAATPA